mmetsp:Transcript_15890/g.31145  ORF Transcript_15890/g.31145 Transcript_15890/m.31145 type:complete len:339 (+) Transcript_15890:57-1073(+)
MVQEKGIEDGFEQQLLSKVNNPNFGKVDRVALRVAEAVLPRELNMLGATMIEDLAALYRVDPDPANLWQPLAIAYLPFLTNPLGNGVSSVSDEMEEDAIAIKADMYWRCSLRLHMMPLSSLKSMAHRWGNNTSSSSTAVDAESKETEPVQNAETSEAQQKIESIRIVLPFFSMIARTQEEIKEEAERKKKREAAKKKAEAAIKKEDAAASQEQKNASKHGSDGAEEKASAAKHTYDYYRKWDEFDVGRAEAEVDRPGTTYSSGTDSDDEQVVEVTEKARVQHQEQEEKEHEKQLDDELREKLADPNIRRHMMELFQGINSEEAKDVDLDAVTDSREND